MEYNPGPELCGFPPRPSTDQLVTHWSPTGHPLVIHWSPTGLTHHIFFKVALPDFILGRIFYVYQYIVVVQEPLIDSLFKNQTVINDVNTTGNRYQKPTDVPIPDISHLVHRRICTSYSITWAIWGYHRLWTKEQQSQFLLKSIT